MLRDMPITTDPVVERMQAIRYFPSRPSKTMRGVELTPQQYDDYSRIAGRLTKQRLDAMVNQPGSAQLPVFAQKEAMKEAVDNSREIATSVIMMQYPGIIAQATDNKTRILRGEKPSKKQTGDDR